MKKIPLAAALTLGLLALAPRLEAQVRVELRVPRRLYMSYEPVVVTIGITNMSGHDITLQDADGQKWCGFEIQAADGRLVPPNDQQSGLVPVTIPVGGTIKRSANLASLFPIGDFGMYHVRASVYYAEGRRFYGSGNTTIEIAEGKLLWQQTVGIPEGKQGAGGQRVLSLLSFRLERDNRLYVRVEDKEAGLIYATQQLGPIISNNSPQAEIDRSNQLHILQLVGLKTYFYTKIGLNGETLDQQTYHAVTSHPNLRKRESGEVAVVGGQIDLPVASNPVQSGPKLSDRPAGFPVAR